MSTITRRLFLGAAAAAPLSLLQSSARAAQPLVRFDVKSPNGQAMLKIYADAVAKMKAKSEGDPQGWTFQWYTHWVPTLNSSLDAPAQKAAEINRIFTMPGPQKDLAGEMWDTCQAHGDGDEDNFLPWHRIFVMAFEQIVRTVTSQPAFALPYWNYSAPGPDQGVLPPEFRKKGDPVFSSLYVEERKPSVNNGDSIQKGHAADWLAVSSLKQCGYSPNGAIPGFCMDLDQTLHGNVHVGVGGSKNMGAVPWAARDPIFWLHHSNIDRLWASWNAAGRKNPTLSQKFVFADKDGKRTEMDVADVLDLAKLGYTYDHMDDVPPCPNPPPIVAAVAAAAAIRPVAMSRAPIQLGAETTTVPLETMPLAGGRATAPFPSHVEAIPANKRFFLVATGLKTDAQPGVLYELYLDLPPNANAQTKKDHYVGTLNFFGASHAGHGQQPKKDKFVSFDITDLSKRLQARNLLTAKPSLSIIPAGKPEDAKPVIGDIKIVEQ